MILTVLAEYLFYSPLRFIWFSGTKISDICMGNGCSSSTTSLVHLFLDNDL
jgi:hypothetical protein